MRESKINSEWGDEDITSARVLPAKRTLCDEGCRDGVFLVLVTLGALSAPRIQNAMRLY